MLQRNAKPEREEYFLKILDTDKCSYFTLSDYFTHASPLSLLLKSDYCPPTPPAILPVSSSRAHSAWLPCGCRNKDQDDSRLTEAAHGVLSTQLCGGQTKGVSQSEGRGRGRDRWQHRMSRAPDRELRGG